MLREAAKRGSVNHTSFAPTTTLRPRRGRVGTRGSRRIKWQSSTRERVAVAPARLRAAPDSTTFQAKRPLVLCLASIAAIAHGPHASKYWIPLMLYSTGFTILLALSRLLGGLLPLVTGRIQAGTKKAG